MRPSFLDNMSWAMAEVYGAVTDRILVNLARYFPYIKDADEIRGSFEYQARMLAQLGQVNRETADIIAKSLDGADAALRGALEAALVDALKNEEPQLRKAAEKGLLQGGGFLPPEVAPNQMQAFSLYYRQSADKLNLVNTVMLESTEAAYTATVADAAARIARTQSILNVGAGEVVTGVSSWNQAMHDAVAKMVQNGLTGFVDHAGHKWSPEAYVAMDIRTTMFNTARAAVWERNEAYGNDLYQVSSHNGARPLCYPWQGKVISRSGWTGEVEDLDGNRVQVHSQREIESFNYGGGLFGVNCRHYPMTFIPGFSTLKGEPQDPEENAKAYAESQQQRALERRLREEKRDLAALRAQGADEDALRAQRAKVSKASSDLDAFCDETGRARRRNREFTPVNAAWPAEGSYDPTTFPTEQRDKMREFFGGAVPTQATPEAPARTSGIQHFDFTPAKTVEEAEAYARRFLQSEKYGSVSYKGIDVEYANTCNRVLNDVYSQYTPKYKLKQIAPMNAREKIFKSIIDSSEACYQWAGDGSMYVNPRFYKSTKVFEAHKKQIEDLTEIVLKDGQKLIDTGRYTGMKRTHLEAVLRTGRQCVSQSYDFVEGTFVHESGHMLDDKLFRKVMKAIDSPLAKMNAIGESRAVFGGGISGYAVTDNNEYIAESFTSWWYGETDKLDPELVRIFEEAKSFDAG